MIGGDGELVATLVFFVAAMPGDVLEDDFVLGQQFIQATPKVFVFYFFELAVLAAFPAVGLPFGHPFADAFADVDAVADESHLGWLLELF